VRRQLLHRRRDLHQRGVHLPDRSDSCFAVGSVCIVDNQ